MKLNIKEMKTGTETQVMLSELLLGHWKTEQNLSKLPEGISESIHEMIEYDIGHFILDVIGIPKEKEFQDVFTTDDNYGGSYGFCRDGYHYDFFDLDISDMNEDQQIQKSISVIFELYDIKKEIDKYISGELDDTTKKL